MAANLGSPSAPADEAEAITKSDTTVIEATRGLYIGSVGDVAVRMKRSQNSITFVGVQTGTMLPIVVDKVLSTGTSASSIVAVR